MPVSRQRGSAAIRVFALLLLSSCSHNIPSGMHSHSSGQATACQPANGREGQPGCWVLANAPVTATGTLYWHVYQIASAEQGRAAGAPSRVIHAFGRTWLVAVAEQRWAPNAGRHIATVGPLPLLSTEPHTASFMEATFTPGMSSRIHTHPGPEAWVVLEGQQCLETPEGVIRGRTGDAMMVRGGLPMQLFGSGRGVRKALVLILHPTGKALGTTNHEWHPRGACLTK
jgi:quercetin dioxygenase-like cupin family protein